MNNYLLLFVGLISIFLEFYLPGVILGAIGVLLVIASVIFYAMESESVPYTILFLLITIASLFAVVQLALWSIRRSKKSQSLMSVDDQDGYVASSFDSTVIGKRGVVASVLKPGGYILVEGKRLAAISLSGYMDEGEEVEVVGGEGDNLKVKKINKEAK